MISHAVRSLPFLLGEVLDWPASVYPDKSALEWEGGGLTFAELVEVVRRRQAFLEQCGAARGQRWGLLLGNHPDFVVSVVALLRLGCTVVPLRCTAPQERLVGHIRLTRLDGLLTCRERIVPVGDAGPETEAVAGAPLRVLSIGGPPARHDNGGSVVDLDPALILLTSGSTGSPRGAILPHHAVLANMRSNIVALGLRDTDRTLVVLPLAHAYGLIHQCFSHLMIGATVCLAPAPVIGVLLHRCLESFRTTTFSTAPPVLQALVAGLKRWRPALPRLRLVTVGTAFADPQVVADFLALLPHTSLAVTYGLTEAGPRVATHFVERDRPFTPECVGQPLPNVAIELRDVGLGQQEIVLRTRSAMSAIVEEGGSERPVPAGALSTGDAGYLRDGALHLKGRMGRIMNRGGVLVSADQVESMLLAHPAVAGARVEPLEHPIWGTVPIATVTPAVGQTLEESQLREYCASRLSAEERPIRFVIRAPVSTCVSGKLQDFTASLE